MRCGRLDYQGVKSKEGKKKKGYEEGAVDNVVGIDFTFRLRHYCREVAPPPKHGVVSLYYLSYSSNPLPCSGVGQDTQNTWSKVRTID